MDYKSPASSPPFPALSFLTRFLCFFLLFPGGIFRGNQQMDQNQTKRAMLKKSIQILLSIFAFSILFTLSPLLPLSSHSLGNFSGKIFSYTPDRNHIFLFCNGILAFLIKNSLRAGSSKENFKQNVQNQQPEPELAEKKDFEEDPAREDDGNPIPVEEEEQQQQQKQEQEQEQEQESEIFVAVEEEEQEDDGMGLLSAEELNKKCDDFIRKMREGIMIEAQRRTDCLVYKL